MPENILRAFYRTTCSQDLVLFLCEQTNNLFLRFLDSGFLTGISSGGGGSLFCQHGLFDRVVKVTQNHKKREACRVYPGLIKLCSCTLRRYCHVIHALTVQPGIKLSHTNRRTKSPRKNRFRRIKLLL